MTAATERWAEITAWFDELIELDRSAQESRLAELDRDDPALAAEVRSLMAADDADSPLLASNAIAAVPGLLADKDSGPGDGMAGPYRLLRSIGEGGMGEVWLAERTDGAYEQQVAVKLLKRGMDTQAILRRFLQERRILARLHHPYIVRLVDGGMSTDGRPFYVMDHVDGQPITHYAAQHALDVRARVALLAEIADAVAYAHTQLVVHRDLKPSNVLVDREGKPRVLDFGIAKLIEESGEQTLTGTGLRVLSPAYAAPEQILGETIGTTTDVYALGLMLCELLTGQLAQRRNNSTPAQLALDAGQEIVDRASTLASRLKSDQVHALYGDNVDIRQLSRNITGDLDLIIATALQREPARRYATAAALADDLRRWLERRPITARGDSAGYRLWKFMRRHRVGVAASAIVVLSLIIGLGAALYQTEKVRQQAEIAQQQASRTERVKEFLIALFQQNDPALAKGKSLSAAEILTRGLVSLETSLATDPETRGELLIAIARIQGNLGEYEAANKTAQAAVSLLADRLPADDLRLADAYIIRGETYSQIDRVIEAERDLRSARAILANDPVKHADRLDDLDRSLAFTLIKTRSAAVAVAMQIGVIERMRLRLPNDAPAIAEHRLSLAVMLEEAGEFTQAESNYRLGLPVLLAVNGALTPTVCEAQMNFAGLLDRMSKSKESLPYFEGALDCRGRLYGRDSEHYGRTLFSRGILWLGLRRYADAEADFRATLTIFGENGTRAAHSRRYLGLALIGENRFAEAAELLERAERLYREVNLPNDMQRWRARADYGYALFKGGDARAGREAIEAALTGLGEVVSDGEAPELMRPLSEFGEVALAQGDFAVAIEAHRRWRALSLKLYGTASRDAYESAHQLSLDLFTVGDRGSLEEAAELIADAVAHARDADEAQLDEYERDKLEIDLALARFVVTRR